MKAAFSIKQAFGEAASGTKSTSFKNVRFNA